jgi:hypothetical protein
VRTGPGELANRRIQPLCRLSAVGAGKRCAEEKWVAISASDTMFSRFFERRLAIFLRPMMRGSSGGFVERNDIFSQKLFLK